jgi:hypothetical protein
VLEALASDPSAGASSLRARIVLARAALPTDAAVANELEVDPRTVGKWRRRYARLGVAGLDELPSEGPGSAPREQALLTPLVESPGGRSWTTRSVAEVTGLSQSTISRVWQAAGFGPPPPDVLVADPLLRGRARLLAGVHVAAGPLSKAPVPDPAESEPRRPAPHLAAAFWVDHQPSTPRSRALEDETSSPAEARHTAWEAATSLCHAAEELIDTLAAPGGPCCDGEFIDFLNVLARRCPGGAGLWVLLNHQPGATLTRWVRGLRERAQLRHTPSAASWTALVARSLAATTLAMSNRDLPSSVEVATAHLRHQVYGSTVGTSAAWLNEAADIQVVFDRLRRPVPRPRQPRHQVDVPDVGEASAGLRRRRPPGFVTDLPVFEQLVHIRQRVADATLVRQDCVDAMVVLADLHATRDLAEHALIRFCRSVWAEPRQIAQRLGVTTLHAVGQRYRRLSEARLGRRSNGGSAAGAARKTPPVDAEGRVRNIADEIVTQLHERWVADLLDQEHRIEQLPGTQDIFGVLAYIVDAARPVPHLADPAQPSPMERRQADGLAGLTLVVDLHHRLQWERLCWYRLAEDVGVTLRELGAPFDRSPAAVLKDRRRLEQRFGNGPAEAVAQRSSRHTYWSDNDTDVRTAIGALLEYRAVFADDEDLLFWLDELAAASDRPEPHVGLFVGFVNDLCEPRECASCTTPRIPVIRDAQDRAVCATCADRGALAELVERAADLSGVPIDHPA